MKWERHGKHSIRRGEYSITKPGRPELYPLPYALYKTYPEPWKQSVLIGHYQTAEAAQAALDAILDSSAQREDANTNTNQGQTNGND